MATSTSPLQYGEEYILRDASGVHMAAAAGISGLRISEEHLVFNKNGTFAYSLYTGNEGEPESMRMQLNTSGKYSVSKNTINLSWAKGSPSTLPKRFPSLISDRSSLMSPSLCGVPPSDQSQSISPQPGTGHSSTEITITPSTKHTQTEHNENEENPFSLQLPEISDILKLDRFVDSAPVDAGIITDFLWSDPDTHTEDWSASPRGAGCLYGRRACKSFLSRNNLQFIVRSHQLVMNGISWELDNLVCTIDSRSSYGYHCGNQGATVVMEEHTAPCGNSTTAVPNVRIVADGTILMREFTWSNLPSYPHPHQQTEYYL
ncbi:hypothetical protein Pelo_1663 [Pelomyxa schiedti]|nr:hypothetical protein Pelo_1663 [Pelomyxa schiedti]